ncbi:hypothetical protein N7493_000557 [Penicillium malachiteum]|uniref:Uncharacterized protein n=1 Tax=Penicillium malachiteum TaxID=1324776 RepID=A0AAD6HWK4_9EURO|nr:hypothetical protein N7493_000557 [Penicillium malachiteum]
MSNSNDTTRQNAFSAAKGEFLASQKDVSLFERTSNAASLDEVYDFVYKLQKQQDNTKTMKNVNRILELLKKLEKYSQVIEQFIQVKPDILALIWGPIKLLLLMADNTRQCFSAIVDIMVAIGDRLPMFEAFEALFGTNNRVLDALILFYKDLLDFFGIALNFLSMKHWKLLFESVWPKHKSKIDVVISNIERHGLLLRDEVNLEHISNAHQARLVDLDNWQRNFQCQERQEFHEIESFISPRLYDDEHDRFQRSICENTGAWIRRDKTIKKWLDPLQSAIKIIWLQGIPGADGLDEIQEAERIIILREILDISQIAPETKVWISSRMEDDISKIIRKTSHKAIRVDDNNKGCIQSYVAVTSQKWLKESDFDDDVRSEIMGILSLLPAKAKGMILYAKVVMENVQMCHDADSIKNELSALPETLEDAYSRILVRLHELQPTTRELSRRALGWIGCSPLPILIQELSFALSIKDGIKDGKGTRNLSIVQLCGPIVEVSGDYVHFVHFTVKEYLFSSQSKCFVNVLNANLDMVQTCLKYLTFDIFDPLINPTDIKRYIMSGDYRLYWFATGQLMPILQKCLNLLRDQALPPSLVKALTLFCQTRDNINFNPSIASIEKSQLDTLKTDGFEVLSEKLPEEHQFLCHALAFHDLDVGKWKLNEGTIALSLEDL